MLVRMWWVLICPFCVQKCIKHDILIAELCFENWAATWENRIFAYAKTRTQISFAVAAKLISAFVFATWIVQSLCFLNPKFQVSSHLLWLYSPDCVGPGRKPRRPVFWRRGSIVFFSSTDICLILMMTSSAKHSYLCIIIISWAASWENLLLCVCKNKVAADQRLCFLYIDNTIPLLSKFEISSL